MRKINVLSLFDGMSSENEAACLLGDGWTVSVISHIFSNLEF